MSHCRPKIKSHKCRIRKDHGPHSIAISRHSALNLRKQETTGKLGITTKRLKAAWNQSSLLHVWQPLFSEYAIALKLRCA